MMLPKCDHEETFWDDELLICANCHEAIGIECLACGGDGIVQEDEYECDWINCGDDLITCPECNGRGWVAERNWQ